VLSANAHLHNGYIHPFPPEDVEGQDCHELEIFRPVVKGVSGTYLQDMVPNLGIPVFFFAQEKQS
jgi:hypothetical protein